MEAFTECPFFGDWIHVCLKQVVFKSLHVLLRIDGKLRTYSFNELIYTYLKILNVPLSTYTYKYTIYVYYIYKYITCVCVLVHVCCALYNHMPKAICKTNINTNAGQRDLRLSHALLQPQPHPSKLLHPLKQLNHHASTILKLQTKNTTTIKLMQDFWNIYGFWSLVTWRFLGPWSWSDGRFPIEAANGLPKDLAKTSPVKP